MRQGPKAKKEGRGGERRGEKSNFKRPGVPTGAHNNILPSPSLLPFFWVCLLSRQERKREKGGGSEPVQVFLSVHYLAVGGREEAGPPPAGCAYVMPKKQNPQISENCTV